MAKYSKGAQKKVESAMKRMEKGTLRSGRSGKKVTNPKQAVAIGLSEARKKGAKVPKKKSAVKRSAAKKTAVKKRATAAPKKKSAAKKSATARKTAVKRSSTARKSSSTAAKKTAKKAVKKTAKKAAPKKRTATNTRTVKETTNLRSATAEMETPVATNHVQTEILQHEDPIRAVDQHAFDRFTSKGDPRQKLQLSSKPKSSIKPSGKKPLWN